METVMNYLFVCVTDSSISFLDHCSFDDESLCQMRVSSAADYGCKRVKSVRGINVTDHTYLSKEQNGEIHQKVSALTSQEETYFNCQKEMLHFHHINSCFDACRNVFLHALQH